MQDYTEECRGKAMLLEELLLQIQLNKCKGMLVHVWYIQLCTWASSWEWGSRYCNCKAGQMQDNIGPSVSNLRHLPPKYHLHNFSLQLNAIMDRELFGLCSHDWFAASLLLFGYGYSIVEYMQDYTGAPTAGSVIYLGCVVGMVQCVNQTDSSLIVHWTVRGDEFVSEDSAAAGRFDPLARYSTHFIDLSVEHHYYYTWFGQQVHDVAAAAAAAAA
ncbi:unnamed protein product [Ilex paraguariensis]|uniref:Uncharacterized protein n=1 Tax=Ilex paraguariensis TaxID=185542 RepID=A0ABC8U293_9AQUA